MSPTAAKPILDIGSLDPERPFLRIDGQSYRYRVDMDLNLVHLARIERIRERLAEMSSEVEKGEQSDPQRAIEVGKLLAEGVALIMYDEIPVDVLGKLNDIQRLAIIDAFTRATLRAASQSSSKAREATPEPIPSTWRPSSPASNASTRRRASRSG